MAAIAVVSSVLGYPREVGEASRAYRRISFTGVTVVAPIDRDPYLLFPTGLTDKWEVLTAHTPNLYELSLSSLPIVWDSVRGTHLSSITLKVLT